MRNAEFEWLFSDICFMSIVRAGFITHLACHQGVWGEELLHFAIPMQ
jgi:hypothetical protein